jgi:hypothetical protein
MRRETRPWIRQRRIGQLVAVLVAILAVLAMIPARAGGTLY